MNTIKKGSQGSDVAQWQKIIGVNPDGNFGSGTEAATIAWQAAHKLTADGVVGPATWGVAIPRSAPILPKTLDENNLHVKAKRATDKLGLTPNESMFTRAVAWHETNYGQGWKPGEGAGSFNMGAITTSQAGPPNFQHKDSRNDTGKIIEYTTWFKGYPSFDEGMKGLANFLLKANVKAALKKGDFAGAAKAMYDNKYYLGVHPRNTPEGNAANVQDYTNAVMKAVTTFTKYTGETIQKSFFVKALGILGLASVIGIGVIAAHKSMRG